MASKDEMSHYIPKDPVRGTLPSENLTDHIEALRRELYDLGVRPKREPEFCAWRALQQAEHSYQEGDVENAQSLVISVAEFVGALGPMAPSKNARKKRSRDLERRLVTFYKSRLWLTRRACVLKFMEFEPKREDPRGRENYLLRILSKQLGPDAKRTGRPPEK